MNDHSPSPCAECESNLAELRSALAEFRRSAKSKEQLRSTLETTRDLLGGTEVEAERAEQILRRFWPQLGGPEPEYQPNRIGKIICKIQDHRRRTGHAIFPGV